MCKTRIPRIVFCLLYAFAALLVLDLPCRGQAVAVAEISGQVTDPTGGAVPGADVTVTQTQTALTRATVTDSKGLFTIPELPVGPYKLEVKAAGFKAYQRGAYYQNPFDRAADRGNCNFDRRHVFNASIVAVSPVKSNNWKGRLLGNWQFAPLLQVRSGTPMNVTSGKDNSLSGEGLDRPNLVSGQPLYGPMGTNRQWINAGAFTANAAGTFGNVGRDTLFGPAYFGFDLALSRLFALHEQIKLESRLEAFNAVNYVNFNNPGSAINSSTFGQINGAGDPRILQIALKLHF